MATFIFPRTILLAVLVMTTGAASAKDLVIGQLASTSNPLVAELSKALTSGYQLAFDHANRAGGVNGNKLILLTKDDQFKADTGVRLAKEMIAKDNIVAFAGCMGTPIINALTEEKVLTDNKIAYLGPFSGSFAALQNPNVFAVRATYESELERIFRQTQTMYQKQVAFLYFKAGIGPVMSKVAVAMAKKYQIDLQSNEGFDVDPDSAIQKSLIASAVATSSKNRPAAIVVIAAGNAMWIAIKHIREVYGGLLPIYSISVVSTDDIIEKVGVKDAQRVVVSQAMPSPIELDRRVVAEYLQDIKRYGTGFKPGYVTLEGYVGGRILAEAIKSAGANPTRESVLRALYGLGDRNIGGIFIKYTEGERHGNMTVDLVVIGKEGILIR